MSNDKHYDGMLKGKNFEEYFNQHMINDWRSKYFAYGEIKGIINQKYLMMVAKIKQTNSAQRNEKDAKFINFSGKETNQEYKDFLQEVEDIIKDDFSRVRLAI